MPFDLPPDAKNAGACILDHLRSKDYSLPWAHVDLPGPPSIRLTVSADALLIGGVRINVSATVQQIIADLLGCLLPTPRIADLIYLAAKASGPVLLPSPQMITSATSATLAHSARVDKALAGIRSDLRPTADGGAPLIATVGKDWVIANELLTYSGKAENYGWPFPGGSFGGQTWEPAVTPGLRVIQGQGWAHDPAHVDYSQICRLVHGRCLIDGQDQSLAEMLSTRADVAKILNHNGLLKVLRQPGVARVEQADNPAAAYFATAVLVGAGAAVGTALAPGIGTLLGAGAGLATDAARRAFLDSGASPPAPTASHDSGSGTSDDGSKDT